MSLILITIGIVLMTIGLALIIMKLIYNTSVAIGKAIYGIMSYILNQVILKKQLESDGTLQRYKERKRLREEIQTAEREKRYNSELKQKHNEIVYAALSKLRDLKMHYPLADEELFNEYRDKYYSVPMCELDDIEEEIKQQHFQRSKNLVLDNYTIDDVELLPIIEQDTKIYDNNTITITLYQDRNTYIVRAQNPSNSIDELYVTQNIILAKHIQQQLIARCKVNYLNRRADKRAILNINDFNNVVGDSIRNIDKYGRR